MATKGFTAVLSVPRYPQAAEAYPDDPLLLTGLATEALYAEQVGRKIIKEARWHNTWGRWTGSGRGGARGWAGLGGIVVRRTQK